MHIYTRIYMYHFIFCASEGAAKNKNKKTTSHFSIAVFAIHAPPPLACCVRVSFISSRWTVVSFISPGLPSRGANDHGQRKGESMSVQVGTSAFCSSPRVSRS